MQYHHCASSAGVALAPYRYCRHESLHKVLIDFPGLWRNAARLYDLGGGYPDQ